MAARKLLRRSFIVVWLVAGLAGALNHGVALGLVGRRFDLVLPHLQYGYVMFNRVPRAISVLRYVTPSGQQGEVADLVGTPAFGYKRARLTMDAMIGRPYIEQLCRAARRDSPASFHLMSDEYDIDSDGRRLKRSVELACATPRESGQ